MLLFQRLLFITAFYFIPLLLIDIPSTSYAVIKFAAIFLLANLCLYAVLSAPSNENRVEIQKIRKWLLNPSSRTEFFTLFISTFRRDFCHFGIPWFLGLMLLLYFMDIDEVRLIECLQTAVVFTWSISLARVTIKSHR